jgi:hypothetical protein
VPGFSRPTFSLAGNDVPLLFANTQIAGDALVHIALGDTRKDFLFLRGKRIDFFLDGLLLQHIGVLV